MNSPALFLDPQTGLCSHRSLMRELEESWSYARLKQAALGLVILDLDMHRVYEHCAGEGPARDAIKQVAAALQYGVARRSDLVARYGPESFALLLRSASYAIVAAAAERSRQAIAALNIPHLGSPHAAVTASVGFASAIPDLDDHAARLVDAAEAALLQAKSQGMNLSLGGVMGMPL